MSHRHCWRRDGVHRYTCERCGLAKRNEGDGRQWVAIFERDGAEVGRGLTPPCPGEPPAPALPWARGADNAPWWDAPTGHRVLALRAGSGWCYFALGPDRSAGWDYRAWRNGTGRHWSGQEPKVHYARGEQILQPREFLGRADTAEAARALCAAHAAQQPGEAA